MSSLCGSPRLAIRRSAGRPPAAWPKSLARSAASPSRQAHPQRDRRPPGRQILQPANLPAVTTGELDITYRTSSGPRAEGQNRPATVAALRPKKLEAGSQSTFGVFDHATIDPVCSPAVKPDPRSHEVRKTRQDGSRQPAGAMRSSSGWPCRRSEPVPGSPVGKRRFLRDPSISFWRTYQIQSGRLDRWKRPEWRLS